MFDFFQVDGTGHVRKQQAKDHAVFWNELQQILEKASQSLSEKHMLYTIKADGGGEIAQ